MGAPRAAGSSVLAADRLPGEQFLPPNPTVGCCFCFKTELFCHKALPAIFTETTEKPHMLFTLFHLTDEETEALG